MCLEVVIHIIFNEEILTTFSSTNYTNGEIDLGDLPSNCKLVLCYNWSCSYCVDSDDDEYGNRSDG
uniref:Uncharacterized protein n=1 Tax=viral metagenome TaxID=1070528 RepID=A0A6C0JB34_9ZZZZ